MDLFNLMENTQENKKVQNNILEKDNVIEEAKAMDKVESIKSVEAEAVEEVEEAIQDETEIIQQENVKELETANITSQQETVEQVEFSPVPTSPTIPSPVPPNILDYSSPPLGLIDGISLMEMEFPKHTVIVENLLHTGLSVLAGMPKLGKSWFCLSLSIAVAGGTDIIGFKTNKSEVLYLSFESKADEIQHRLNILLQEEPIPNGIHFCTDIKTLDNGLIEFLQDTIDKYPKIELIIIDPLQFIRSSKIGGGTLYQKEYKEMSQLKEFADKNNVCILAVHHLKNIQTKDVFAKMYGSNAIRGATNTNIVMLKQDETSEIIFSVESRDVESTTKIIQMNNEHCRWEVVSANVEETNYRENPVVITIKKMLEEHPDGVETKMTEVKDRMQQELEINEETYSPQSISREISQHLIPLLMKYDNIRCKRPNLNGGVKGRVWKFYYEKDEEIGTDKEEL